MKKFFSMNKIALISAIILCVLIIVSILAPIITEYDVSSIDLYNISSKPSSEHILGTDELGRDVFARLIYGGRISLCVGIFATTIQIIIGVSLGMLSGFFGGVVDFMIMRIVDIIMCFPFFVVAIALASVTGPSILNLVMIIAILSWTDIARIVRAEVMSIKEREFILATKALGVGNFKIITRHILPNIFSSILVAATLSIANAILMESALSFLGMGVRQPMPSWGNMLTEAQNMRVLSSQWWLWVPPGVCIILSVLSINFLGDGLKRNI